MASVTLDVLGEVCPAPLYKVQQKMAAIAAGDKVIVLTDFSRSVRNILEWAEEQGYSCEVDDIEAGVWRLTLAKNGVYQI